MAKRNARKSPSLTVVPDRVAGVPLETLGGQADGRAVAPAFGQPPLGLFDNLRIEKLISARVPRAMASRTP